MLPRQLAHRGSVVASGFVIDAALVGAAEARRRVLTLWSPGAVVRELDGAFVITGLAPARVRTAQALGTPLVEQHGVLSALPLERDEAAQLAAPGTIAVIARGGVAEAVASDRVRAVDLAGWLDLDELTIADVTTLAAPPPQLAVPPPAQTDVRVLTGAPAADPGAAELAEALASVRAGKPVRERSVPARAAGPSRWRRFVQWLSARLSRRKALPPGRPAKHGDRAPAAGAGAPKPSLLERLRARIAHALWSSRLGAALGRRHAEYLRRTLEMFDRGELDEALRHAIPIGGDATLDSRLALSTPRPREKLELSFARRGGGAAIPVADVAMSMLRERYRNAATRLEQTGRIDEAAFVLAELLADVIGAIALLERHGRFAVAAKLAEGRGLEPGLIVRLWFLAGDRERAVDVARRHQAWGDAVTRLERAKDPRAPVLRMLWADHLADIGDFVQAVDVAWPVQPSRALVETWIDRGIAAEGTVAARMYVKKLVVAPASFPAVAPAVLALLGRGDAEGIRQHRAFAEELVRSPASAELQTLARPAFRTLVQDRGAGADAITADLIDRVERHANDAALHVDRPALPAARSGGATLVDRAEPVTLSWAAHDAGALPVHDAAVLPGDRMLLALGELGVRIIGRDDRIIAHIDQPAHRLVVSDLGTRALAIAPRGEVHRIARLDLVERRGAYWCDAELDDAVASFDGDLWLARRGRELFAVDTTASRWRAAWGVQLDPALEYQVRRDGRWFAVTHVGADDFDHWFYDGFTMRKRLPQLSVPNELRITRPAHSETFSLPDASMIAAVEVAGDRVVIDRRTPAQRLVTVAHLPRIRPLAHLFLDGTNAIRMRIQGDVLVVADDRGRVIALDLVRGALLRDIRL